MNIADAGRLQAFLQDIAVELRIMAGFRYRSDVNEELNVVRPERIDEIFNGMRGMADGKYRLRHRQRMIASMLKERNNETYMSGLRLLMIDRNSSRVGGLVRKTPSTDEVTKEEFCFSTPRIIMHRWRASIMTPTPSALIESLIA